MDIAVKYIIFGIGSYATKNCVASFTLILFGSRIYCTLVILPNHFSSTKISVAEVDSFIVRALNTSINLSQQKMNRLRTCLCSSFGFEFTRTRRNSTELNRFPAESLQSAALKIFNKRVTDRIVP